MSEVLLEAIASMLGALWPHVDSDSDNLHLRTARNIRNRLLLAGVVAITIFAIAIWLTGLRSQ